MKKNTLLKIVNPILALALLYQVATGLLHGIIPRGSFESVHVTGGMVLIVCAVIHLLLNWNWVKANLPVKSKTDA